MLFGECSLSRGCRPQQEGTDTPLPRHFHLQLWGDFSGLPKSAVIQSGPCLRQDLLMDGHVQKRPPQAGHPGGMLSCCPSRLTEDPGSTGSSCPSVIKAHERDGGRPDMLLPARTGTREPCNSEMMRFYGRVWLCSATTINHGLRSTAKCHLLLSAPLVVARDFSQNKVQTG